MLHALESFLAAPIVDALSNDISVVRGPYAPAGTGAVVIHARSLKVAPPPVENEGGGERSYLFERITWSADGSRLDFEIPAAQTGELVEVESPLGYIAKSGDDYFVEGRTIHFYRPPPAGAQAVRARLRGDDAEGWARRRRCTVVLELAAWANTIVNADNQLQIALQVALAEMVALPILELSPVAGYHVSLRMITPSIWLAGMHRKFHSDASLYKTAARVELRGELDIVVARGEPIPHGIIDDIIHRASLLPP
jgi:hypothetical protein